MTNANLQPPDKMDGTAPGQMPATSMDVQLFDRKVRPGRASIWASLAAGVSIVGLGVGAWCWPEAQTGQRIEAGSGTPSTEQVFVVKPLPVSQQLDMTGTIAAGKFVTIVAPFDGVIREKRVQLGEHVVAGDVLLSMNTSDIASRYRDAQSAYIKAAMAADALDKWETGSDMQRARRTLDAARLQLATLERQVADLKGLLDQGIVSRNEYDGVVQQRDAQANTVAGASDELATTQTRGNDENRKLVMLELENAQSRLSDLKQQMAGAKVATAIAGILTRPPDNGGRENPLSVEPGASVTRGAALFAIADTSTFIVTGAVDEIDVNRVKIGQAVTITSDAFPGTAVTGKIVSVSAEAGGKDISGRAPSFEVRASFEIGDGDVRGAIRIGMSARMTIETYANAVALIVPPSVIVKSGAGAQVRIRQNGDVVMAPVLLGKTFPEGVEVLSGISAGDRIIIQ